MTSSSTDALALLKLQYDAPRGLRDTWLLWGLPRDVRRHLLAVFFVWIAATCVPVLPVYTEQTCVGRCCENIETAWRADFPPERGSVAYDFGLYCGKHSATAVGAFRSSYFGGCLLGAVLGGVLADRYGRRSVVYVASVLLTVATASSTIAPGPRVYAMVRFIAGGTQTALCLAAYVLGLEALQDSWQAPIGAGLFMSTFSVGQVVLNASARLITSWRYLSLFVAVQIIITTLVGSSYIKESPRWVTATANASITSTTKLAEEGEASRLREPHADVGSQPRWGTLAPMMLVWLSISSTFYGLTLSTGSMVGNLYWVAFGSAAVELPAALLAGSLRFRRDGDAGGKLKLATCISIICGGITCGISHIAPESAQTHTATIAKFFFALSFNFVYPFTMHIFANPSTRTRVMGLCLSSSRFGAMISPILIARVGLKDAYAVFGYTAFVASVLAYFLV